MLFFSVEDVDIKVQYMMYECFLMKMTSCSFKRHGAPDKNFSHYPQYLMTFMGMAFRRYMNDSNGVNVGKVLLNSEEKTLEEL